MNLENAIEELYNKDVIANYKQERLLTLAWCLQHAPAEQAERALEILNAEIDWRLISEPSGKAAEMVDRLEAVAAEFLNLKTEAEKKALAREESIFHAGELEGRKG